MDSALVGGCEASPTLSAPSCIPRARECQLCVRAAAGGEEEPRKQDVFFLLVFRLLVRVRVDEIFPGIQRAGRRTLARDGGQIRWEHFRLACSYLPRRRN